MARAAGARRQRRAAVLALPFALLGIAISWGSLAVPVRAETKPATSCQVFGNVTTIGEWAVIHAPAFPNQALASTQRFDGEIRGFAIDPLQPSRLYITNGRAVSKSVDGGCTWDRVYDLPNAPADAGTLSSLTSRIVAVTVPTAPLDHDRVELLVYDSRAAFFDTPHVLRSVDGGASWKQVDNGLPATAAPPSSNRCVDHERCAIVAAPSDPNVLYYVHAPTGAASVVYASVPGGSWQRRTGPIRGAPGASELPHPGATQPPGSVIVSLRVDPLDPARLWALTDAGYLYGSSDGAFTWRLVRAPEGSEQPTLLSVVRQTGAPPRITLLAPASESTTARALVSRDGGATFQTTLAPSLTGNLLSVAQGEPLATLVVTTTAGVFRYDPQGDRFVNVDASHFSPLDTAEIGALGASPDVFFRMRQDLVVYRGLSQLLADARRTIGEDTSPIGLQPPLGGPPLGGPLPANLRGLAPGTAQLEPAFVTLKLQPGESRTLPYTLGLAGRSPPALDVFFLISSNERMASALPGVKAAVRQLVNRLAVARPDTRVGLGEFSDVSLRYRRLRDIGPPDGEFAAKLAAIEPGRGDLEPPNLTALHQMATGAGVVRPTEGNPVRKGEGATFRPNALHVVVHVAEENFNADDDGPTRDQTLAALNAKQILHIGVMITHPGKIPVISVPAALDPEKTDQEYLRAELEDLAVATGALAPPAGLDCDGDNRIEIPAGAPIVCNLPDTGGEIAVAPLLLRRLVTVTTHAPVDLVGTGGAIGLTVTGAQPGVDVTRDQLVRFAVTFACPAGRTVPSTPVLLAAQVAKATVAAATATVSCGATAAATALVARPPVIGGLAVATPPPIPSAAAGPAPATASAHATQVAQAAEPGVQGATAYAPQQQAQVAGASTEPEEHRFVATAGHRRAVPATAVLVGAAALTAAAALLTRRRPETEPVRLADGRRRDRP